MLKNWPSEWGPDHPGLTWCGFVPFVAKLYVHNRRLCCCSDPVSRTLIHAGLQLTPKISLLKPKWRDKLTDIHINICRERADWIELTALQTHHAWLCQGEGNETSHTIYLTHTPPMAFVTPVHSERCAIPVFFFHSTLMILSSLFAAREYIKHKKQGRAVSACVAIANSFNGIFGNETQWSTCI